MDVRKLIEEGARAICIEIGEDPDADMFGFIPLKDSDKMWCTFYNEASAVIALTLRAAAEDIIKFRDGWPHDSASRKAYEVAIIHLRALAEQVEKANG